MNYLILAIIITISFLIIGLIIYHFFGRNYEFTEKEKNELDLIDHLKDINNSEYLLGKISHKQYKETKDMLIKMVDEVEKRNRKKFWWLQ